MKELSFLEKVRLDIEMLGKALFELAYSNRL